jgi:hypothetical protein
MRWENPTLSERMIKFADTLTNVLKEMVEKVGATVAFTYGNSAGIGDTVYSGLSDSTQRRLREVSKKYDPQDIFQKLVPGFKLDKKLAAN